MDKKPTFKPRESTFLGSSRFCDACTGVAFFAGTALEIPLKGKFSAIPDGAFTIFFGVVACVMLLLKNILEHKTQEERHSPSHLDSFTRALHPILIAAGPKHGEPELRVSLYIPHGNGNLIVTDAVGFGTEECSPVDRTKGVIGRAAREKKLAIATLPIKGEPTVADFFVRHLGYERSEAMKHDQRRRVWAAVPVMNGETLEAVLYCDSLDRDFFGNANSVRRKILEAAVTGVVDFIRSR